MRTSPATAVTQATPISALPTRIRRRRLMPTPTSPSTAEKPTLRTITTRTSLRVRRAGRADEAAAPRRRRDGLAFAPGRSECGGARSGYAGPHRPPVGFARDCGAPRRVDLHGRLARAARTWG